MSGKTLRLHCGDRRRDLEGACRLGETHNIVLQNLPVNRLDTERHLRLLIDKDELAVLRGQNVKLAGHFGVPFAL